MYQPSKFRYINEIVGTFVVLGVVFMTVAFVLTMGAQKWLEPRTKLSVLLPEEGSYGLETGADVKVLGTAVGKVERITISKEGRMTAESNILSDFYQFVRVDSIAVLKKDIGLVSERYIEITPGSGKLFDETTPVIRGIVEKDIFVSMAEKLEELERVIIPTIQEYGHLAADLRSTDSHMEELLTSMNLVVKNVEHSKGIIPKLFTDKDLAADLVNTITGITSVLDNMQGVLKSTENTSNKIADLTAGFESLMHEIPQLIVRTEKVLENTSVIMKDIHSTMENNPDLAQNLGKGLEELPEMFLQSKQTLIEIERLVLGIQRHWLVRDYIDQETPVTRIPPAEIIFEREKE